MEEDIEKLIEKGESETLEFKENFDKETIKSACAFANKEGGIILLGVSDKGEIKGVKTGREKLKDWVNEISQLTEPRIIPEIKTLEVKEKIIIAILIKESPLKPVACKEVCYLRIKNSNKKLTPKEIAELHLQTIGSSWDSYSTNAKLEDVDIEKVSSYIKLANQTGRKKIKEGPIDILKKLELIKGRNPSWAAILLFGKEPQSFVLQAKIHCGKFKLIKTEILDDLMIEGNLTKQADEAMDFIKKHIGVKFVITGKPKREEVWEYPLGALREAVINAIVHRDYTELGEIQVEVYDDRIEIWNPGKLPFGITIEDLYEETHKSVPRNKVIAQIFYDIGFIEKYGSGTARMLYLCKKAEVFLEFKEISGGFSVIFRKDVFTEDYLKGLGLNEREINAVMAVKEKGKITNKEYQESFSVSKKTASRELAELAEKNILERKGVTGKGTFYILMSQRGHKGVIKGS